MISEDKKINILGLTHNSLIELLNEIGEPKFRAQQIIQWIHQKFVENIVDIHNISKLCKQKLSMRTKLELPFISVESFASNDGTKKWLFTLIDNAIIETVYIPEARRATLCISSQAGCALACKFCVTGKQGLQRNLNKDEIIAQLWFVQKFIKEHNQHSENKLLSVTNIVFMGMGEPLMNLPNVQNTIQLLLDDNAYALARKKVTLSTVGIVPKLRTFTLTSQCALAISLHAPNDTIRDKIIPINKKYNLDCLMQELQFYCKTHPKMTITIEYIMLHNINDTQKNAFELSKLLYRYNIKCKINLIPFNNFENAPYDRSTNHNIKIFTEILKSKGYIVTVRQERGGDIHGACGQLAGSIISRSRKLFNQNIAISNNID